MAAVRVKKERSVDWTEIVFSLNNAGSNTKNIADAIGVTSQSVAQWRDGVAKPTYDNGVCLIGLWIMTLKLDHNRIPRI